MNIPKFWTKIESKILNLVSITAWNKFKHIYINIYNITKLIPN